jgi:hypothetical protein
VRVKPEWVHAYGLPDASLSGVVTALSPNGTLIRVQMDELGHSHVWAAHVERLSTDDWRFSDRRRSGKPEAAGLLE